MKNIDAEAILQHIGELLRERNQLRQALAEAKKELAAARIEKDEALARVRRAERIDKPAT